jgi:hypothetical protein
MIVKAEEDWSLEWGGTGGRGIWCEPSDGLSGWLPPDCCQLNCAAAQGMAVQYLRKGDFQVIHQK